MLITRVRCIHCGTPYLLRLSGEPAEGAELSVATAEYCNGCETARRQALAAIPKRFVRELGPSDVSVDEVRRVIAQQVAYGRWSVQKVSHSWPAGDPEDVTDITAIRGAGVHQGRVFFLTERRKTGEVFVQEHVARDLVTGDVRPWNAVPRGAWHEL